MTTAAATSATSAFRGGESAPGDEVPAFDGHPGRVRAVTFTAGLDELASGGEDGTIRLWDLSRGVELRSVLAHPGGVTAAVVVGRQGRLATTGADRRVRLWDRSTGEPLPIDAPDGVDALAGTARSDRLAVAAAGSVRIVDLASGDQLAAYAAPDGVRAMAMSADGSTLAWTGRNGTVVVWDLGSGTSTRVAAHPGGLSALALCPTGHWLVTADADRTVRLWDLDTRTELQALGTHRARVRAVAISDDRRLVVSGGDDGLITATEPGTDVVAAIGAHPGGVCALAVGPGADLVASGGGDRTVRLWGPDDGITRPALAGHTGGVRTLAVSRDGRRVVSGGDDRRLRVWDLATGAPTGRPVGGPVGAGRAAGLRSDDVTVVLAGDDGVIWSWDPVTGRAASAPTGRPGASDRPGGPGVVSAAAVAPDGRRVITGGTDGGLAVWDTRTGARVTVLRGHLDRIAVVALTRDGRRAVTGGADRTVRVWDLASGVERRVLTARSPVTALVLPPDGVSVLIGGDDGRILRWDLGGGPATAAPTVVADHGAPVSALAVSPAGDQVVSGGADGSIRIWDRARPADPLVLRGHPGPIGALAVTPDGRHVVSGGDDGSIRIWDRSQGTLIAGTGADRLPPPPAAPLGLVGDGARTADRVGRGDDIATVAALVADRATEPPLTLAVLGPPGSGTSAFLHQVHDQVNHLAAVSGANPGRSAAVATVRQVWVDAGHLTGEAAWLGLVDHLAAALADTGSTPDPGVLSTETAELNAELTGVRRRLDRVERGLAGQRRHPVRGSAALAAALARTPPPDRRWLRASAVAVGLVAVGADLLTRTGALEAREAVLAVVVAVLVAGLPLAAAAVRVAAARHDRRRAEAETAAPGPRESPTAAWIAGRPRSWRLRPRRRLRGRAERRRADLHGEVHAGQERLDRTDAARRLAALVAEARAGEAPPVGALRRAHDDLRRLSDDLTAARAAWRQAGAPGPPPLERVLVYVDGLDRCPARTAVDLLAALHWLLPHPLYAVIAAADPEWLRRSTGGAGSSATNGRRAPEDLDRLFPIVFGLRPLGDDADDLVDALLSPPEAGGPTGPTGAAPATEAGTGVLDPQPDRLHLRPPERELIRRLRPLLTTPRAIKRYVNLYRLLRLGIPDDGLAGFVGADGTGEHQAALVLLALTVSSPEAARVVFRALAPDRGDGPPRCAGDMWMLLRHLADDTPDLVPVVRLLDDVRADIDLPGDLDRYRRWAGTVARFSIETCDLTRPG
jgi:WD40 repeat protein